ncbi:hypothetical protein [Treponema socranskii]
MRKKEVPNGKAVPRNEGVVYDIANMLAGGVWDAKKNWNYASFAKAPGDALGCAVLSRYPLGAMTVHALDIRTHAKQPRMRPLISLSVFAGSKRLAVCIGFRHRVRKPCQIAVAFGKRSRDVQLLL